MGNEEEKTMVAVGDIITVRVVGAEKCHLGGRLRYNGEAFSYEVTHRDEDVTEVELPRYLELIGPGEAPPVDEGPVVTPCGVPVTEPLDVKIRAALTQIDHGDDANWTGKGLPSVEVVDNLCGNVGVTRDAIENAQGGSPVVRASLDDA